MSGISGDRAGDNWTGRGTGGRSWEELSSGNERLVPVPGERPRPDDSGPGSDVAARWHARRGRCDLRQVVSAA